MLSWLPKIYRWFVLGAAGKFRLGVRNGLEMEQFGVELRRVVDRPSLS